MIKNARFFQISLVLLNIKFEKDIVRRKRRGVELEVVQFYEYIVNIRINIETHWVKNNHFFYAFILLAYKMGHC